MPPRTRFSARRLALDVLNGVFERNPQPAETAFERHPKLAALSARDRAFARTLYATTLRRLGGIDRSLRPFLSKWPKDVELLNCLRIGVVQLHHLKTPAHAAIGETVNLAKEVAPFGAKMVNAVLRRVSESEPASSAPENDLPKWLTQRWRRHYGAEKTAEIVRALAQPPLDLTVPNNRAAWVERLGGRLLGPATLRVEHSGSIDSLVGYDEGAWWVQDVAAASIVPLMGDIRGKKVLDLCAAPGGKTAQLIAAGAEVTAVEAVASRAERLKSNLSRLKMGCEVIVDDARNLAVERKFDAVLLDAPCSATGTLRRHPDIAWARRENDILRLAVLQRELLDAASVHLSMGGELVYAVCSLEPEEGSELVENFLINHSNWRRQHFDIEELMGAALSFSESGELRSVPSDLAEIGGADGFFAARLVKRE